ncbi:hypothetical protein LUZ63_010551 [Rhynchospora breviuscula]|uniref:Cyclin n=1 Tax=Rhynchospora breviuscula TaxID=2022672 RepID=A0A9Q0HQ35_9POAL|nr:hypothetical protein LUZ63_010551 [Rhynchospora breviuscula]
MLSIGNNQRALSSNKLKSLHKLTLSKKQKTKGIIKITLDLPRPSHSLISLERPPSLSLFISLPSLSSSLGGKEIRETKKYNTRNLHNKCHLNSRPMADPAFDPGSIPKVVSILSSLLERVSERNDAASSSPSTSPSSTAMVTRSVASAFQGLTKPSISVRDYLERIFRFAGCSPSCYVVAYIYLDRYLQRHPTVTIDSLNVHRFLITSVLTAVKFVDDICYNNAYFAKVGGITLMEMNYLEVDFLFGVGFELNVTPVTFTSYCSILQNEMQYLETQHLPPPSRLNCFISEEESSNCHQKQLAV